MPIGSVSIWVATGERLRQLDSRRAWLIRFQNTLHAPCVTCVIRELIWHRVGPNQRSQNRGLLLGILNLRLFECWAFGTRCTKLRKIDVLIQNFDVD